jgi:hypothetical protein
MLASKKCEVVETHVAPACDIGGRSSSSLLDVEDSVAYLSSSLELPPHDMAAKLDPRTYRQKLMIRMLDR